MEATPASDGYYLPPRWTPAAQCWLAWPSRIEAWDGVYEHSCLAVAELARTLADFLPVEMLVSPQMAPLARLQLAGRADLVNTELNDCFPGDFGPQFLRGTDGNTAGAVFAFNGWGNAHSDYRRNEVFAEELLQRLELPIYRSPLVLEGTSIDTDGRGTLLASADSILNSDRNPVFDEQQVESRLALHLGVRRIIWLEGVPATGARQGQLVDLARFIGPGRIACAVTRDSADPLHDLLMRNLRVLQTAGQTTGASFDLVEVPVAESESDGHGGYRARSYLNFLLPPDALVIPSYGVEEDAVAADLLAEQFPGRQVRQNPAQYLMSHGNGLCSLALFRPV
jgi:agmatine deiminase